MSTPRERVIGRIREGIARRSSDTAHHPAHVPHRVPLAAAPEARVHSTPNAERFASELSLLGGEVHRAADDAAAIATIVRLCLDRQAAAVLAWDEHEIGLPGVRTALLTAGIGWDTGELPSDEGARRERLATLGQMTIGVTGAAGAIVESGTLALISGPGRSRLASLLVPVHVAILREEQLYPTLGALLGALSDATDRGSNLVLVTGPSRTGDIEMTLTRGVHGPGEVHVILLDSSRPSG